MTSVLKVIIAVFFLSILPLPVHALTPSQVFDKVKDSVVVVKALDAQGKMKGFGSGVLISTSRVATNCHVVEGGISYRVGRGNQLVSATLYAEDRDKDICLLDATDITGKQVQLGKATDLKVGVPVYAVGAPQGLELSLSDGIVSQLRGVPTPLIQTTAAISPGSSGGGLFDGEGRLVGLTTLYIEGGQSLNFAMPVEWIGDVKPGRKQAAGGRSQTEWVKRTIALEQMKDWQGMLDWCQKWTKNEPEDAAAWYYLGLVYNELKRYDDAIEAYRQALLINPEYANAWKSLGLTYNKLKRDDDALDACRQAVRIDPTDTVSRYNLGIVYDHLERYNDAIDAFREVLLRALRISPEYTNALNNLGIIYNRLHRYDDAIEAFNESIRLTPDDVIAYITRGAAYVYLGQYKYARADFDEAIRLKPDENPAYYNYACMFAIQKDTTQACSFLVRAIERGYKNWKHLEADKDFDNIKSEKCFDDILNKYAR